MKKTILFFFIAAVAASCSDNVDGPTISPATEKTLAEGLSVSPNGIDTTIVFPLTSSSKTGVTIQADDQQQWCSAYQEADSENGFMKIHVKCAPSGYRMLQQRMAGVTITAGNKIYELHVRQAPAKLAFPEKNVYHIPSSGGAFDMQVFANTPFSVSRAIYVSGSGKETHTIDTGWAQLKGDNKNIQGKAGKPSTIHFEADMNTGLGRKAVFYVGGDSVSNEDGFFSIMQEPRQLKQRETLETDAFSQLDILLGNDPANLARMKALKINGIVSTLGLRYIATTNGFALDTLDLSTSHYSKYGDTDDRSIEKRLFFGSNIGNILLPNNLDNIKAEAFANCNKLSAISIPASVTSIGERAFASSANIKEINIPQDSKLASIGEEAFNTGSVIGSLLIPASVTYLSKNALKGLQAKELHVKLATPPSLQGNVYSDCVLYVPKGSLEKYKAADYWKNYKDIREE